MAGCKIQESKKKARRSINCMLYKQLCTQHAFAQFYYTNLSDRFVCLFKQETPSSLKGTNIFSNDFVLEKIVLS